MSAAPPRDPLHGITLEKIVTRLHDMYGWEELAKAVPIRCFQFDPSIKSSLTFLRRMPWARTQVEALYVRAWIPHAMERGLDPSG